MKFIHLSDTHLKKDKYHHYGRNPYLGLELAIKSINKYQNDADFVVLTGDLADTGEIEAYEKLKEILSTSKVKTICMIGNHDNRENFLNIFDNNFINEDFIQGSLQINDKVCIFLDTKIEGTHAGDMCEKRFSWFENELKKYSNNDVYIFMHHNPMSIDIEEMDKIKFKSSQKLKNIFLGNKNIKHLFFGHLHMAVSGVFGGVPYFGVRGTNHQLSTLSSKGTFYISDRIVPAYGVVNVYEKDILCILHEYLDEEIKAFSFE